jgi:hypothetical protein
MLHNVKIFQLLILTCLFCITVLTHVELLASTGLNQSLIPNETPDGLSASDWNSIQAQVKAGKYKAYADHNGGYRSSNPAHGWQIHYAEDGTTTLSPRDTGVTAYHLGLKLSAIGYHNLKSLQRPQKISSQNNTIEYHWNDALSERWVNNESNLEQWFTLTQRPTEVVRGYPLTLQMTLDSRLSAKQHGNNIRFSNASGTTTITYNKLKVWDSTGRQLPARMQLDLQRLSLIVDDSTARYPLTIDPSFQQQAYLKASNTGGGDFFGSSVAISGNTVVIGAVGEDSNATGINGNQSDNSASFSGAVYVFTRNGNSWSQQAYLKASNTEASDQFGRSVAISGNTVVVGAPVEASNATGVNGDQSDNTALETGAAYVFTRDGNTWSQQAYLKASNTEAEDLFGDAVTIAGDTVVVGAWREASNTTGINGDQNDNSAVNAGAAYVFTRNDNTWSQQAYLKASNTEASDNFGFSVAIVDNTVVIGAENEDSNATGVDGDQDNNFAENSGAAYVFTRSGNTWSQQAYLKASNTVARDNFGFSVAIANNTVVIGAPVEDNNTTEIDGDQDNNLTENTGTAYVFTRSGSTWSQQVYLKDFNTEAKNRFGFSVAVTGNAVVVGAPGEVNNDTGVNDNQGNNLASDAGAAYLFTQSGNIWSQQAYLRASHTDKDDQFGFSVAITDNTALVSALDEDSNSTGIDNDQSNNLADGAGAAYVFAIPTQQTVANEGFWWIPSKPGSGFDIGINSDNNLYMIWYTYTLNGRPIWYLASAPLNGNDWRADLYEFTWDGNTTISNRVGDARLIFQDVSHATLSWTLNTGNGSTNIEYFVFDQGSNVSAGTWFDPGQPGYGLTQVNQGTTQVKVLYFYDQAGNPVWVLGSGAATAQTTNMDSFTGTCPVCPHESSVASPAGTVQTSGVLSTEINLLSPLSGAWQIFDATISNLSE